MYAQHGTTLIELMIAVALFAIISGVSFMLMNSQQNSAVNMGSQTGLNMALRNSASMLQMDLANAGSYFYQDVNKSTGALGLTILNNVVATGTSSGTSCHTVGTTVYGNTCFDQFSIINVDSTYPVLNATDSTGGNSETTNCSHTNSGTAYGYPNSTNPYKIGDQLLLVTNSGAQYTSVVLTAVPATSGSTLKFIFNATSAPTNAAANTYYGGATTLGPNDPLNIAACSGAATCLPTTVTLPANNQLTSTFCGTDYILKLAPISYQVCSGPGSPTVPYACDQSANSPDIADPKLIRYANGTASIVMEQIIGFKVGCAVWNDPASSSIGDITNYNYDSSSYTKYLSGGAPVAGANAFNFTLLHSVRVSIIGRTTPATTDNYVYRNAFDGGAYQVQGTALVVNPRNMNLEGW